MQGAAGVLVTAPQYKTQCPGRRLGTATSRQERKMARPVWRGTETRPTPGSQKRDWMEVLGTFLSRDKAQPLGEMTQPALVHLAGTVAWNSFCPRTEDL